MKRKDIIYQRDLKDCGPCCLLSIIRHYKGNVPLEKIRLDTYADDRGTSAYHLIKAAKSYGFEANGIKCQNFKNITRLPAIAHVILENGLNHFVVIYKIKNDKLTIMDPAKGKLVLNKAEFLKLWDNIIIEFQPKHEIINYPMQNDVVHFFVKLLFKEKQKYLLLILLSIIIMISSLLSGFYLKIGDFLIHNNKTNYIFILFISFILITLLKTLITFWHNGLYNKLNKNVHRNLLSDFVSHIFFLPLNILHNKTSGEIITRVNELKEIKEFFSEMFITLLLDVLLVITSISVLALINLKLFLIILITYILYTIVSLLFANKVNTKIRRWMDTESDYNTCLIENIEMANIINNLQIKPQINLWLDYKLSQVIKEDYNLKKILNIEQVLKLIVKDLGLLLLNTFALYQILLNQFDLINLITFNSIVNCFSESYESIISIIPHFYYLKNSIYKVSEFRNLPKEKDNGIFVPKYNDIQIKNLQVSYDDTTNIINNFSYKLRAGKSYFLNGLSGCGKSTLIKCLYKEINNYQGDILLGKLNYKDISAKWIKDNFTIINQNESLYSDTIYQNIICHRTISKKQFKRVCQICLIDKIIAKKPLRFLSNIADSLTNLSGGEKQQIILARNLLKNGNYIIVDEALSEVDVKTEIEIIKNIKRYYQNKTIIYVSHKDLRKYFDYCINMPKNIHK